MRKSRSEQSRTYRGMNNAMIKSNDTNGCSVIAIAIAFNISYEQSYGLFNTIGRRHGKGVTTWDIEQVAHALAVSMGKDIVFMKPNRINELKELMGVTPTLNNIVKILPKSGKFLVWVSGHVVAVKGGRVHDHSEGSKCQVRNILEIV